MRLKPLGCCIFKSTSQIIRDQASIGALVALGFRHRNFLHLQPVAQNINR
jgi:hypothetical protein